MVSQNLNEIFTFIIFMNYSFHKHITDLKSRMCILGNILREQITILMIIYLIPMVF